MLIGDKQLTLKKNIKESTPYNDQRKSGNCKINQLWLC